MHHSNELFESSALVALHESERQQEIARRRRLLTARDVLRWPFRAFRWLLVVPARTVYRRVRRARAPRRGWSAGRERSSFLGRPGVTREAKGLKPADPEVTKLRAQLDEFRTANVELQAASVRMPTAAEEQATRDRGDAIQRSLQWPLAEATRLVVETQSDMATPNEGPGITTSAIDRVAAVVERQALRQSYKPTGPTSDEARKATRLLQAERQRKTSSEAQAERERHLQEGRAAMAEDERQFEGWIQQHEDSVRNKGK